MCVHAALLRGVWFATMPIRYRSFRIHTKADMELVPPPVADGEAPAAFVDMTKDELATAIRHLLGDAACYESAATLVRTQGLDGGFLLDLHTTSEEIVDHLCELEWADRAAKAAERKLCSAAGCCRALAACKYACYVVVCCACCAPPRPGAPRRVKKPADWTREGRPRELLCELFDELLEDPTRVRMALPVAAAPKALLGAHYKYKAADLEPDALRAWRSDAGRTRLMAACEAGRADEAVALLALGARVHATSGGVDGGTALHCACMRENAALARLLVRAGARPNQRDAAGWTSLHHAAYHDSLDTIRVLLAAGADARVRVKLSGLAPLDLARTADVRALLRATALAQSNASDALSVARREKRYGFIRRKLRRLARSLGCRKAVRKLARPTGGGAPAKEQKEP